MKIIKKLKPWNVNKYISIQITNNFVSNNYFISIFVMKTCCDKDLLHFWHVLRRKAIKEYFWKKSDEINQDPCQFWNMYQQFLHSRRAYKSNDIILKEGEEIITDKASIAETFNDYYINIANHIGMPTFDEYGQELASHPSVNAIEQNRPPLCSHMTGFSFSPCNSIVVEQILQDLKTNKSPGYDSITPKLLKFSAEFISLPLSTIFNTAIAQWKYP